MGKDGGERREGGGKQKGEQSGDSEKHQPWAESDGSRNRLERQREMAGDARRDRQRETLTDELIQGQRKLQTGECAQTPAR